MTEWTPTANMTAMLSYLQGRDYGAQIEEASQAVGISKQAYYQWFDNPEFCRWWIDQAHRWAARQLPRVVAAVVEAAVNEGAAPRGSATDRKTFLERYDDGYSPKERKEISGAVAVNHSEMIAASLNGGFHRTNRISGLMGGVN